MKQAQAKQEPTPLTRIILPGRKVEQPNGRAVEIYETADAAVKGIDIKLQRLYALRECIKSDGNDNQVPSKINTT